MQHTTLTALSPLDGRYANQLISLRPIMSEYGLIYHRLFIEIRWLEFLAESKEFAEVSKLSDSAKHFLQYILEEFDLSAAEQIKTIEQTTNHDVKAIEYYIRNQLLHHAELAPLVPFIHFGCTSEDINNLAYSLMFKKMRDEVLSPAMLAIINQLQTMAQQYHNAAILCRTHGQPASPSTMGKELVNFIHRLERQYQQWRTSPILAKFNGAIGNFNAHSVAYPELDWPKISEQFINSLGLSANAYTTQIEPHDNLAELLQILTRFNTILIDLNRDLWGYISLGYFNQQKIEEEIGSSTMPHKINPIDFENSEGNLGLANALANHFASKLPISRWQRDLSDSTVLRNLGSIGGYSLLAYKAHLKGLSKLTLDQVATRQDLEDHWEILAEALQTVMRRYGVFDAYERLKLLTRGETINQEKIKNFILEQPIPDSVKKQLMTLTPMTYLGFAKELTESSLHKHALRSKDEAIK